MDKELSLVKAFCLGAMIMFWLVVIAALCAAQPAVNNLKVRSHTALDSEGIGLRDDSGTTVVWVKDAGEATITLGDAAGAKLFLVTDSGDVTQFSLDSDGNGDFLGDLSVASGKKLIFDGAGGNDYVYFASSQLWNYVGGLATWSTGLGVQHTYLDSVGNQGPIIYLDHTVTGNGSSGQYSGEIIFRGEDAAGNTETFGWVRVVNTDATDGSEDGTMHLGIVEAGTDVWIMSLLADSVDLYDNVLLVTELDADTGNSVDWKLGDAAGSNRFSLHDSGDAEIAYVDSDGNALFDAFFRAGSSYAGTPQAPIQAMNGSGVGGSWTNLPANQIALIAECADDVVWIAGTSTDWVFRVTDDSNYSNAYEAEFRFDNNTTDQWEWDIAGTEVMTLNANGELSLYAGLTVNSNLGDFDTIFSGDTVEALRVDAGTDDVIVNNGGAAAVDLTVKGDTKTLIDSDAANDTLGFGQAADSAIEFSFYGSEAPASTQYLMKIHADGGDEDYWAMDIWAGKDAPISSGECIFINFADGDGTQLDYCEYDGSSGVWFSSASDPRLKDNLTTSTLFARSGQIIDAVGGVRQWNWKRDTGRATSVTATGFDADVMHSVFPEATTTGRMVLLNDDGTTRVEQVRRVYQAKMVQPLTAETFKLRRRVRRLERENALMRRQINWIVAKMSSPGEGRGTGWDISTLPVK